MGENGCEQSYQNKAGKTVLLFQGQHGVYPLKDLTTKMILEEFKFLDDTTPLLGTDPGSLRQFIERKFIELDLDYTATQKLQEHLRRYLRGTVTVFAYSANVLLFRSNESYFILSYYPEVDH